MSTKDSIELTFRSIAGDTLCVVVQDPQWEHQGKYRIVHNNRVLKNTYMSLSHATTDAINMYQVIKELNEGK